MENEYEGIVEEIRSIYGTREPDQSTLENFANYIEQGKFEDGISLADDEDISGVKNLFEQCHSSFLDGSRTATEMGMTQTARKLAERIKEEDDLYIDDAKYLAEMGFVEIAKKKLDEFKEMDYDDARNGTFFVGVAELAETLGEHELSQEKYKDAYNLLRYLKDPYPADKERLAGILEKLGRPNRAREVCEQALEDSIEGRMYRYAVKFAEESEDSERVQEIYERIIKGSIERRDYRQAVEFAERLKDSERGQEIFEQAMEGSIKHGDCKAVVELAEKLKDPERVQGVYKQAMEMAIKHGDCKAIDEFAEKLGVPSRAKEVRARCELELILRRALGSAKKFAEENRLPPALSKNVYENVLKRHVRDLEIEIIAREDMNKATRLAVEARWPREEIKKMYKRALANFFKGNYYIE